MDLGILYRKHQSSLMQALTVCAILSGRTFRHTIFVNVCHHAHIPLGPLLVLNWTIEVNMDPLIGSSDLWKWELWSQRQHALPGGGLADLAVPDMLFDFCIHVRPPVAFLDAFRCFEEAHVAHYLGVMALLDQMVMHHGWYNHPKVCAILEPFPPRQSHVQHSFPHFHEGEVWPHHTWWNQAVTFQCH
jgi:hypothetical protein